MVRHDGVYEVLGSALRHVTIHARGVRRIFMWDGMALSAHAIVVPGGFGTVRNIVRVVAGEAGQRAVAAEKTLRLAEPIGGVDDLVLVIPSGAGGMIEKDHEFAERLSRPVRERASIKSSDRIRQPEAGGFEMALHAHLHPWTGSQAFGIEDRLACVLRRSARRLRRAHVIRPGAMAALAIDPFGQRACEDRFGAGLLVAGGDRRIGVMAEHTVVADFPP